MDSADTLVEEIRVELNRLTGGNVWTAARWAVGQLIKQQHATFPRIEWEEIGGDIEDAQLIGGADGNVGVDASKWQVTVWNKDRELCRNTMHALRVAARNVCFGPNVIFGSYAWIDDANVKQGRKLTFQITLRIPVPSEVAQTADLETFNHQVIVGGAVVC